MARLPPQPAKVHVPEPEPEHTHERAPTMTHQPADPYGRDQIPTDTASRVEQHEEQLAEHAKALESHQIVLESLKRDNHDMHLNATQKDNEAQILTGCFQFIIAPILISVIALGSGWWVYNHNEESWAADCSRACEGIGMHYGGHGGEGNGDRCVCSGGGRLIRFGDNYECTRQIYPPPMDAGAGVGSFCQ